MAGERTTTSRTESEGAERRWWVSAWGAHSVGVLEMSGRTAVRCFKGSRRGRAVSAAQGDCGAAGSDMVCWSVSLAIACSRLPAPWLPQKRHCSCINQVAVHARRPVRPCMDPIQTRFSRCGVPLNVNLDQNINPEMAKRGRHLYAWQAARAP